MDWHDTLDRAIPAAPDSPQPDALAAGRSALRRRRRRRAMLGAGFAGTAAAASVTVALTLAGGATHTADQPLWVGDSDAATPTPTSSPTASGLGPVIGVLTPAPGVTISRDPSVFGPSGVVKLYDQVDDVVNGDGGTGLGWAWLDEDGKVYFGVGTADGLAIATSYPRSNFVDDAAIVAAFHKWLKDDGPFSFGPVK